MAELKSDKVTVKASAESVYTFLTDLNNVEKLIPSERVSDWKSTSDTCSFTIKGLAGISMKLGESESNKKVHLDSHGKNPFDFSLDIHLENGEGTCNAQLIFEGNMNFMLQTLASTPLTNLFNMMANKLVEEFN